MCRKVVREGLTLNLAAASFNVGEDAIQVGASLWQAGVAGLEGRSSRPHRLREPTCGQVVERVEALRRERWTGQRIAQAAG
jgi:transposase